VKILIFGGNGYLGKQLCATLGNCIVPTGDIADQQNVSKWLCMEPDVVINAAGRTGSPNVDWCEDHKAETFHSNVTGAAVLLEACLWRGIYFVHVGSGCIYTGAGEWKEGDAPNFDGSYYSYTKMLADSMMRRHDVLNLRLRMPFNHSDSERNLLTKLSRYDKVLGAVNSMTYVPDFLLASKTLIDQRITGTFNIVNPFPVSPYDVARAMGRDPACITEEELRTLTRAPRSSCVLSCEKIAGYYKMRPTADALRESGIYRWEAELDDTKPHHRR
jgi:3,5-epimerase/4-reductase